MGVRPRPRRGDGRSDLVVQRADQGGVPRLAVVGLLVTGADIGPLGAIAAIGTVFLVLLATLWALDVSNVDVAQAFAAWSLTRLLTAIPITPGGLGIVELGLTGALVAAGAGDAEAVATALVYRALTWLPPILTGLPAILFWRRLDRVAA